MQQALRREAEYFDEKKRLLRAIFNETLAQCVDAFRSKNVPKGMLSTLCHFFSLFTNMLSRLQTNSRKCASRRTTSGTFAP